MSADPEICIIGAGPGGLYAALMLARQGIPSLVLDRASFPRPKVCGDILTSNVIRSLHALDPELLTQLQQQDWVWELKASTFGGPDGPAIEVPFDSPTNTQMGLPSCLSARRIDFDAFILEYARKSPLIQIRQSVWVKSASRKGETWNLEIATKESTTNAQLQFRIVIIAAGANSPLATQMVPGYHLQPKHSAVGIRTYYTNVKPGPRPDQSEFYLFERKLMPGGLYITPFSDASVNVNIVMRYDIFRKHKVNLRELLRNYLASHPELQERFREARQSAAPEGCILFFGTQKRPISSHGCMLIGDAAGLTDATNANGIGHAMISGKLAAETAAQALATSRSDATFLYQYDKAVYQRLQNALLPGKIMRILFANRISSRLSASILKASFRRLNSKAISELVYSPSTAKTLLNPRFYLRLFSKRKP